MHIDREYFRKKLVSPGRLAFHGQVLEFSTLDISVAGMKILINIDHVMDELTPVRVFLDELSTEGHAVVVWSKNADDGARTIGLKFDCLKANTSEQPPPVYVSKQVAPIPRHH